MPPSTPRPSPLPALSIVLLLLVPLAGAAWLTPDARHVWADPALETATAQAPDEPRILLLGLETPPDAGLVAWLETRGFATHAFRHVPVAAVVATAKDVPRLAGAPGVLSISLDHEVDWHTAAEALVDGAPGNWGGTGDAMTRADAARALGFDGSGVGVAVVDTGANGHHPALRPRELGGPLVENVKCVLGPDHVPAANPVSLPVKLCIEGQLDTDTTGGHGTHVAAIAAGAWTEDALFGGRAPGADLIALGIGEGGSIFWVLAAYEWILEHQSEHNIRVVNNSFGTCCAYVPLHPINLATKALDEAGVLVVFSGGNGGPGQRTMNSYSQAPHVIATGDATLSGAIVTSSGRGDPHSGKAGPDLVAPGFNIVSARSAPASTLDASLKTYAYDMGIAPPEHVVLHRAMTGTSMAAPQVAGAAALMFQANPDLTPAQARTILQETARPIVGWPYAAQGRGMLDAHAAVLSAQGLPVPERAWVAPQVVHQDGRTFTYPFHAALPGLPVPLSATTHDLQFPVHLPAETLEVTLSWQADAVAHVEAYETFRMTLLGADGEVVHHERLADDVAAGATSFTLTVDAATLEAHARRGWSAAYWSAIVKLDEGLVVYDLDARVTYLNDTLPEVVRSTPPPPPPLPPREPHEPIVIASDDDFTSENGVTGGSGTPEDPYVIENWAIRAGSGEAILLGGPLGTTKHVELRNVRIHDGTAYCMKLENADNVRVVDSRFDGCKWSLHVGGDSRNLVVEDNVFDLNQRGVTMYGAADVVIRNNLFTRSTDPAVIAGQGVANRGTATTRVQVEGNTIIGGDDSGILISSPGATGIVLRDNRFGGEAQINLNTGTFGNLIESTTWLDGPPRYQSAVLFVNAPENAPLNTIVDAGSDRAPAADGTVCFDDALADVAPPYTLLGIEWDFGDGTSRAGEVRPCHAYAQPDGAYEARLLVTVQDAGGEPRVLEDTVQVG